ncbi:GatB/YqeY domain-containing protein, partial [Athelia psychrophila]
MLRTPLRLLRPRLVQPRFYSTEVHSSDDIRVRLMSEVKSALKSKDTVKSTTLRSVLSEVYAADKSASPKISSASIIAILRKAAARRADAAAQYTAASRPDLAETEIREAAVLGALLPPLLPEADVDVVLAEVMKSDEMKGVEGKRALGIMLKGFYARVEKGNADSGLVKRKAEALLAQS